MFDAYWNLFSDQFKPVTDQARKLADVTLNHAEQLATFQLDAARDYVNLGLAQARAASDVSDSTSLSEYLNKQQEHASTIGRKLGNDAEALASIGKKYSADVVSLAREGATNFQSAAASKSRSRKSA